MLAYLKIIFWKIHCFNSKYMYPFFFPDIVRLVSSLPVLAFEIVIPST